jgi:hypothetical protein
MRVRRLPAILCMAILVAVPAAGQSLRDRLTEGSRAVAGAVDQAARRVDESVTSTVGLARNEATPAETRAKLDRMADETLQRFLAGTPGAADLFAVSAGYAVFDTRRASLLGVVAGFGRGVAVSPGHRRRVYMNMGTGGVGLAFGFGGFESQVVILFETPVDFDRFVDHGFDATAEAGARAGRDSADQTLRFVDGRSFFVLGRNGWRVNASAAGTRYWPAPDLN